MSGAFSIQNRQRAVPVNTRYLRRIAETLLRNLPGINHFDLGVCLVGSEEMTRLNETFLHHQGPTDVITFDYSPRPGRGALPRVRSNRPPDSAQAAPLAGIEVLHGEIFICVDEAQAQGRRFRTAWQAELVRYLIHGMLHLLGYEDLHPASRHKMKREENRRLRELRHSFALAKVAGPRIRRCRARAANRKSKIPPAFP